MRECGYERTPPVEETLASYLSMGKTSSLKTPSLPSISLQAVLLKDLDKGQGLSPDEVAELRRTTDLALRATKQAATAMGTIFSSSEFFGASVEAVVEKFREARARSAAFKTFIPRRSRSEPAQHGGPGQSRSEERRQAQKTTVATCAPPPPTGGSRRKRGSRGGRQDLREVIQTRQRSRLDQSGIFLRTSYRTYDVLGFLIAVSLSKPDKCCPPAMGFR
ncbi:hypothetical protein H4Q32_030142 [Labeo rohita]|uniref:Uncharacterized protein n=1 Tax=Labeo rohita TaxID=84645 RepID=A0ABQ8MG00_LABRO|nr:hypothetical protein H4Q32_030142 [Labeo rohita]